MTTDRQLDLFAGLGLPPLPPEDTDCGWLVRFLLDGSERSLNEILAASFRERGCGLTVHSRVADLRTKWGFDVAWRHEAGAKRGASSRYRLVR